MNSVLQLQPVTPSNHGGGCQPCHKTAPMILAWLLYSRGTRVEMFPYLPGCLFIETWPLVHSYTVKVLTLQWNNKKGWRWTLNLWVLLIRYSLFLFSLQMASFTRILISLDFTLVTPVKQLLNADPTPELNCTHFISWNWQRGCLSVNRPNTFEPLITSLLCRKQPSGRGNISA